MKTIIELKSTQLELAIGHFLDKENGLNDLLRMNLNNLMKQERSLFLVQENKKKNKGNGYRTGLVYGYGKQLEL